MENKSIKVTFCKCPIDNRKELFKKSNCIAPINVGQNLKVHEGDKFFATIKLINASFKACTLLIDDSIQRHTMKIQSDLPEKLLHERVIKEGDIWLTRNRFIYEQFSIPYTILRWDDWLKHPSFNKRYELVSNLYQKDEQYRYAFQVTIDSFIKRYGNKINSNLFDYDRAYKHCLNYLLEECSVMCLWADEGYNFEIYPSGRNEAMKATYEKFILPNDKHLLISVSLHFKKLTNKFSQQKESRVFKVEEFM